MTDIKRNIKYSELKRICDYVFKGDFIPSVDEEDIIKDVAKLVSKTRSIKTAYRFLNVVYNSFHQQFLKDETGLENWRTAQVYDINEILQWVKNYGGSIDYDIDGIL